MSARVGLFGLVLVAVGVLLLGAGALAGATVAGVPMMGGGSLGNGGGMMGPSGMMGGTSGLGMMAGIAGQSEPSPGESGFVAGTQAKPRVVRVIAGPAYAFTPSDIAVTNGETVTFEVTSMGGLVHEFMVGPADAVAADRAGTSEIADIGMMQTKTLTYTFDGAGPYAFACHAPGHYEAGMTGTITVVG